MPAPGSSRGSVVQQARRSIFGAAAILVSSLAAVAPASAFTDPEIKAIFQALDTNGDGKVTREEYSANKVDLRE